MTERQPSVLLRAYDSFELRRFPAHELIEVEVQGDFLSAGNRGFRPLVNYIGGMNATGSQMAMTAPVAQSALADDRYLVTFVLPAETDPDSVPLPRDARVRVRHVEEYEAAVVSFSGGWNEQRFARASAKLLHAVAEAGLRAHGAPIFARFDPPWKPGFLKYNEVIQPVASAAVPQT